MLPEKEQITIYGHILHSFCYLPALIIRNDELAKSFATAEKSAAALSATILKHTGIEQRRYAQPDEATSDLIVHAVQNSSIQKEKLDAVVVATTSGDHPSPATAHFVHAGLKLPHAVHCFDVASSCSSFLSAFRSTLGVLFTSNNNVLIAAAEVKNTGLPPTDLRTRSLFGDGAAGIVLKRKVINKNYDFFQFCYQETNSDIIQNIIIPVGGSRMPTTISNIHDNKLYLKQPKETFLIIVKSLLKAIQIAWLARTKLLNEMNEKSPESIPCTIFIHQANKNILIEVKEKLNPELSKKIPILMADIGNTVCASLPILRTRFLFIKSIIKYENNFVCKNELISYFKFLCGKSNYIKYSIKNTGISFTTVWENETIEIFDAGSTCLEDSWLEQIKTEEYSEIITLIKNENISCKNKLTNLKSLDIWIAAGGGFQTIALLHGKI